jgi:hypothetical protein
MLGILAISYLLRTLIPTLIYCHCLCLWHARSLYYRQEKEIGRREGRKGMECIIFKVGNKMEFVTKRDPFNWFSGNGITQRNGQFTLNLWNYLVPGNHCE